MFQQTKKLIIILFIITAGFFAAHFALAQSDNLLFGGLQNETGNAIGLPEGGDPRIMIANIIRVALGFLGVIAVALIMYAGWLWMTAGGNMENIEKAKKILIGAVIGLVIILLSFAIASYVIGKLYEATGGGGGGSCNPEETRSCGCNGTGEQVCSAAGAWGPCDVPPCGELPDSLVITSRQPGEGITVPMNTVVRYRFNQGVDGNTVDSSTFTVEDSSGTVAGDYETIGSRVEFKPSSGACPPNECGATECFAANETISVEAVSGNIMNKAGTVALTCTLTNPCTLTFNTNDIVDCEKPSVEILPDPLPQICVDDTVNPSVDLGFNASDDSGVSQIIFDVDGGTLDFLTSETISCGAGVCGQLPGVWNMPPGTVQWYPTSTFYEAGKAYTLNATAYDLDNNQTKDIKKITLRPGHCCDGIKNDDEDGQDCGGSCAACDGAACDIGDDDPDVCTTPDDSICASGFCDTTDCVCISAPIIDWVAPEGGFCNLSPNTFCGSNNSICNAINAGDTCNKNTPNGAPGNLITIGGRYFGTTSGTVEFSNDNGASWTAATLGGCSGSWGNEQIIVIVPNISGSGWIIKITADNGFEDITNDGRGPIVDDFIVNNIERPGLCSVDPDTNGDGVADGVLGNTMAYSGLKLTGASAFFGNFESSIAGLESSFSSAAAGTAKVPNLPTGKTTTFAKNNLEVPSNYLKFTKTAEPKIGPRISSFSPIQGNKGQYITIYGSGLGNANASQVGESHRVYFDDDVSDNTEETFYGTEADFDFPDVCADGLWKDNQIIVKVPAGLTDGVDYYLVVDFDSWDAPVDTSGIIPAAGIDNSFKYDESLPLAPSLCKIAPVMGPNNSAVSLWGEYFGAGAAAKVKFQLNKFQGPPLTILQDSEANRINTTVPTDAISGPVSVIQGSDEGNSLNFQVGLCSETSDPEAACGGVVCCPAGSFRAGMCAADNPDLGGNDDGVTNEEDCFADIGSSVYEWEFSTGQGGGVGDPCKTDQETGACNINNSGCNPGLECEASSCTCQLVGTCSGYNLNQCIEGPFCPNSPGQCSPYAGGSSIDVGDCSNSSCDGIGACTSSCSYGGGLNKCVDNTQACSLDSTTQDVSGKDITMYCSVYDNGAASVNVWTINTNLSCPAGWTNIGLNKCVDLASTCDLCAAGFFCLDNNGSGVCAINQNICPTGSICDGTDCIKTDKGSCECCCDIAAPAGQDCCVGLTCEGTCGSDTADDGSGFGMCSGCADAGTTQTDRDAACNCAGTTGKICDTNNPEFPNGVCVDAPVTGEDCSGSYCPDTGFPACADDTNWCDPDEECTCQPIGVGTPCDETIETPECNEITDFCESVGLICDPDNPTDPCTCQESGNDAGGSCEDPDNPPACDPNACKPGLSCFTETWPPSAGNCGICCCEIGGNGCGENLVCNYAEDAGGCTDTQQGVAPDFGLCCGCSSDDQCGGDVYAIGCSDDSCCRPRPEIDSVVPAEDEENVCRNAAIQVNFNEKMDIKSFSGNVVVVGDYGFGLCPEGTQYILAENENKGFFAKLIDMPIRFIKKIFYLLNPEARALTVNFCAIPGKVSGQHNADNTTTLTFSPDGLFDGNREYYVIIKGDGIIDNNIDEGVKSAVGVSMADNWPDFDGNGLSDSDRTLNGTVYYGYAWKFKTMGALNANNGVCKIDHVIVSPESYLFSTVKDDVKENDADSDSPDFDKIADADKVFYAAAVSADSQPLSKISGVYEWSWNWTVQPNMVADFDSENPFSATDSKQLFAAKEGITDGKAVITATANVDPSGSAADESEFYSAKADVWVFVCENPWPPIDPVSGFWSPWKDEVQGTNCIGGTGACHQVNYDLYYCRDASGVGTADDLPAILSNNTIIRGASSVNSILKEFYFFREAAPTAAGGINLTANNISTTTDGTVALSWSAPAGGADGYKIYYGASSGNYDFYIDVGSSLAEEISGLTINKTYYFSVTAYSNTGAESGYSSEASVEIKDPAAPKAPVSLNLEKACDGEAAISWNKNSEDTAGYKVYYGSTQSGQYGDSVDVKDADSVTLKGLNNGVKYYLAVKAYDESGNESVYSNEVAFTVGDSSQGTCFDANDGLVLWQTFDSADISGNIAKDKSGNGNDGTIMGATSATGKVGQALSFDGSSNYVNMGIEGPDISEIAGDKLTLAAWVKTSANSSQQIISKNAPMTLYIKSNGEVAAELYVGLDSSPIWKYTSTSKTIDSNWHYVAMVYDGANIKIFIDGAPEVTSPNTGVMGGNGCMQVGRNTTSGCDTGASSYFNGLIDEVRVYNRALSDNDIKALYEQSANTSLWSSMVSQWKFDEGAGNIAHDNVGGSNCVLFGSAMFKNDVSRGSYAYFNGKQGSYADCGNDPRLTIPNAITIAFWHRKDGENKKGYVQDIISKRNNYSIGYGLLWAEVNGTIDRELTTSVSLENGAWIHNVHTYDASTGIGISYQNGAPLLAKKYNVGSAPYILAQSSNNFWISHKSDYMVNGGIDEVIIFNKALSGDEAKLLYQSYK